MALVIFSKCTLARSRLRTVTMRTLAAFAGGLTLAGMAGGFGLALIFDDAIHAAAGRSPEFANLDPSRPESQALISEIGSLSGRMSQLEAQAGRLTKSIGAKRPPLAVAKDAETDAARKPAGGPLIAPPSLDGSGTAESLLQLSRGLDGVESRLDLVASVVARRDLDQMAFPGRAPVPGVERTSGFGRRIDPFTRRPAVHAGLDFGAMYGTPVIASAGGRVRRAGPYGAFGRTVEIDHGDGLVTRYGHLSRVLVRVGDIVLPEQAIATVGSTGRSSGAHLHFEILRDGKQVNPDLYLAGDEH